ncbi:MAG: UPF0149 family protein [Gammaproteobacteria bacterium]|jgi:uncharacterized protein|nr:UPF0149 family protein [Gammaproteobacteria bacterium]MBT4494067.1 UPF0149 family protein [Gammaproteobacteria bacterium]
MSTYSNFQNELNAHGIDLHASELHGLLVGYACGAKEGQRVQREALYSDWLGGDVPAELFKRLESAYTGTLESLDEYADFGFRLMMPEDSQPIHERVKSLALWCSGFLSGLGESGRRIDLAGEDVGEILGDLGRVAAMTDHISEGEENEEDLAEIEEFVRVGVLLVFSEKDSASGRNR